MDECGLVMIGHQPHFSIHYGLDREDRGFAVRAYFEKHQTCDRNSKSFHQRFIIPCNSPVPDANTNRMWVKRILRYVKAPENVLLVRVVVERLQDVPLALMLLRYECRPQCEEDFKVTFKFVSLKLRTSCASNRV